MRSVVVDTSWHPLVDGCPPAWAVGWGQDRQGVFVEFAVNETIQRLRWIRPGRFVMGSPGNEPGHFADEDPQHEVILSHGFWMFDTPCTQGLWQTVMNDNKSQFQSPDRPVEQVSWNEVQDFLARLNRRIPDLNLSLPSEAQWEYACRADSTTALYSGDIDIRGERDAPTLDTIAWYGGNSGLDFDLATGHDSKGWPEKQYPHKEAGTHPVGLKRRNGWGLYDMLGNVSEWCADEWNDSYKGAPTDGQAWTGSSSKPGARVIRGGSWFSFARLVRAAARRWYSSDERREDIGFRCVRVQP